MSKYQVGDILRVRHWDDMVAEFGESRNGRIRCEASVAFTDRMIYLCGKEVTIQSVVSRTSVSGEKFDAYHFSGDDGWVITEGMLEIIDNVDIDVDQRGVKRLDKFLSKFQIIT